MIERLTYFVYAAGWALVKAIPERVAYFCARQLGDLAVVRRRWRGRGLKQLEKNLRRVVGNDMPEKEFDHLLRAAMRSYLRYWIEVFRLPVMPRDRVVSRTICVDEHLLRDAVASGRGVVLALPHLGNWDAAGAWATGTGMPFTTVAERLKPEKLYDRFVAFRESLGMEVLALTGDKQSPLATMTERLRGGGTVFLVADRDLAGNGIEVDFFGEPTTFPGGPAALALRTGAVCLAATLWFRDGGWGIKIHAIEPPDTRPSGGPIKAMTEQIARAFEEGIAAHPEDWHMLQPLWLADRPAARVPA